MNHERESGITTTSGELDISPPAESFATPVCSPLKAFAARTSKKCDIIVVTNWLMASPRGHEMTVNVTNV